MRFQPDGALVELWAQYRLNDEEKQEQLRKYDQAMTKAYENFVQETIDKFSSKAKAELFSLFERLDVTEDTRREFDCDLDAETLKPKIEQKIEILTAIAESREARMAEKKRELDSLFIEIGESMPTHLNDIFTSKRIDIQSMKSVDTAIDCARARRQQILELFEGKKHSYWQLCDETGVSSSKRQSFVNAHNEYSPENMASYDAELAKLQRQKQSHSEEIYKQEQTLIISLKNELHIPEHEDITLIELKRLHAQMKPCLQLINQREQLLSASSTQPNRAKNILPQVERRLRIALTRYRTQYGRDLKWDGEEYIKKLAHVQIIPCDTPHRRTLAPPTTVSTLFGNAAKTPRRSMENDLTITNILDM